MRVCVCKEFTGNPMNPFWGNLKKEEGRRRCDCSHNSWLISHSRKCFSHNSKNIYRSLLAMCQKGKNFKKKLNFILIITFVFH